MRTLKKYANGRFYDTDNKQYVTKDELARLINAKEKIKIILAKTGKDITKSVVASLPATKKADVQGGNRPLVNIASIKRGLTVTASGSPSRSTKIWTRSWR
jgi:polyhydroxyalkanoate synthesis regulator protein